MNSSKTERLAEVAQISLTDSSIPFTWLILLFSTGKSQRLKSYHSCKIIHDIKNKIGLKDKSMIKVSLVIAIRRKPKRRRLKKGGSSSTKSGSYSKKSYTKRTKKLEDR